MLLMMMMMILRIRLAVDSCVSLVLGCNSDYSPKKVPAAAVG